uniref:Uncharacterized protein n=1 Tax=Angiostrongylus cantonensis TaxID=6313 RepID=A0A0K0DFX4_ANGCA
MMCKRERRPELKCPITSVIRRTQHNMAAPIPFRTNENKYTPSFPPVVYYRDTFGLEPLSDRERKATESGAEGSDNDSIATKSTGEWNLKICIGITVEITNSLCEQS